MDRNRTTAAALHELAAAARRFAEQCGPTNRDQLWRQAADSLADLLGLAAAEIAPSEQATKPEGGPPFFPTCPADFPADSPAMALYRHWLGMSDTEDRWKLIEIVNLPPGCFGQVPIPGALVDFAVRQLAGVAPGASAHSALAAMYGGKVPTFKMAAALALGAMDETPGRWVAIVPEEDRWDREEEGPEAGEVSA